MAKSTNISTSAPLSQTHQMERKSKQSECLVKILSIILILVFAGLLITVGCAFGELIPWGIAALPLLLELTLIFACLVGLHKIKTEQSKKKPIITSSELSLQDLSSMFSSKDQKKIFFPTKKNTSSLNPAIWFSKGRLQEAFSNKWKPKFFLSSQTLYESPDYNVSLRLQIGDISIFDTIIIPSPNKRGAIVNAADANMSPGSSGISRALSNRVSNESWENSKEGRTKLNVSEVSAGKWISKNPPEPDVLEPSYLFQALGPEPSEYPDTFQAYKALILTYTNCFQKANSLDVTHLQLPLLASFGVLDRGWPIMARLAFLAALHLFLEKKPENSLKSVTLVDLNTPPEFE